MSRDLLNLPHLANKLAEAQAKLAGTSVGLPGSHPHPRRVMKEGAKFIEEPYEETTTKPRNPRRRRQKDQVSKRRGKVAEAGSGGSDGNGGSGETDTGGGVYQSEVEVLPSGTDLNKITEHTRQSLKILGVIE